MKCLDTYALIEIAKANPLFAEYVSAEIVITDLTLAEFYAVLLHEDGKQTAEYWFRKFAPYGVSTNKEILKEAVLFRYNHQKERLSFFDAVGYIYALKYQHQFVTGDKAFEGKKGVEFRK